MLCIISIILNLCFTNRPYYVFILRRRIAAAQSCGLIREDQNSCRLFVTNFLCNKDDIDPFSPASWNEECCTGVCSRCPIPSFPVPEELQGKEVELSLWSIKEVAGRKKYGLWRVTKKVEELAVELERDVGTMKLHIFTAAICWENLRQDIQDLQPGEDLLTYEDFQMNFELTHFEMPTSMAYAANGFSLAMYPVGVKFCRPSVGGETPQVETGAIIFLTPDLRHDCYQVEGFEKRSLNIVFSRSDDNDGDNGIENDDDNEDDNDDDDDDDDYHDDDDDGDSGPHEDLMTFH